MGQAYKLASRYEQMVWRDKEEYFWQGRISNLINFKDCANEKLSWILDLFMLNYLKFKLFIYFIDIDIRMSNFSFFIVFVCKLLLYIF